MTDKERMYANPLEWKLMVAKNTGCVKVLYDELNGLLETINRLETENKNYSHNIKKLTEDHRKLQIRLRKEQHQFEDLGKMYSEIRAEAIKEFAEKLRREFPIEPMGYSGIGSMYSADGIRSKVNSLVKEMVGEDK
jgi:predicted nuclease with TOPRIM domain